MTEVFEELSIFGDPIAKREMVTERLLREEIKLKEKEACGGTTHDLKALTFKLRPRKK